MKPTVGRPALLFCPALLALALALAGCAGTVLRAPATLLPPRAAADGRVHVAVQPVARAGPVSGYLQTPRGGGVGTTDFRRPTLKEIGVTEAAEFGAQVRVDYKRHQAVFEWSQLRLRGDSVLENALVSQAQTFPARTKVDSDSDLAQLAARYNYLFELPVGPRDRIALRPGVGIRGVGVDYRLAGSNGAETNRGYTTFAPAVGLDWSWRPRSEGNLLFSGYVGQTIEAFLSQGRRTSIFDATGRMHYVLSPRASVFLETGYRHVLLDDTQPLLQNRVHTDFGPWIGLGADVGF